MDIQRPSNARRTRIRRIIYGAASLLAVALLTIGVSRLKPAAPTVDVSTVWPDTVKRGPMVRQVRGLGTLVPEDLRWIPATTQGRVERIVVWPGTAVRADTVILELTNPELDQEVQDARLKVQSAEASLVNVRVLLQQELLAQKAAAASLEAEYQKAQMQAEMTEALARDQLVSELARRQATLEASQLLVRRDIGQEQLATRAETTRAQLAVQQSTLDQARAVLALKVRQRDELQVRAGLDGMLQLVPVAVGQQVAPGTNLARVANPARLKAEIRIAETQAPDLQVGQPATIDTRNGVVPGRVTRIDPSVQNGTRTVDVALEGPLPNGAVPDLSVDGTIELERLPEVLYMGRPAFGQDKSTVGLFKIDPVSHVASRVPVTLGRSSVTTIEVVAGLQAGDRVILSDMSAWDHVDRVQLR
jgi:HlyD family secretion protein